MSKQRSKNTLDISLKLETIYDCIKTLKECVKEISSHTPQASTSTEVIPKEPKITQRSGGTTLLVTSDGGRHESDETVR